MSHDGELARRPQVRFERPGSFTPPTGPSPEPRVQHDLPKTADNLPRHEGAYVVLRDAWGDEVFIPLIEVEHTWAMTHGESTYTVIVTGVVQTSDTSSYSHQYSQERTGEITVNDRASPGISSVIPRHPYLP